MSDFHRTTSYFDPFISQYASKRLPIQTPKSFLIYWFHHLKAPAINTSSDLPLSNPSIKPFIIPLHVIIRTFASYPFVASPPVAILSHFLCWCLFPQSPLIWCRWCGYLMSPYPPCILKVKLLYNTLQTQVLIIHHCLQN